ncbi:class II aldolase/adducin family protein [Paraburkholderia fungorum]|jgi:ribulose-5-phosphate 4-epimerase/fuculose-1-phosphate aldolase|uniref:class II aldolase/adducin family protein n=1 Tax=Paraburkholderia fungorum TaxID=134537 RepID=UPI0038BBC766
MTAPQTEWEVRCELAGLYRLMSHLKMTDLIDTHITARVPGEQNHFLINRYGVLFNEMKASDLVKIDAAGRVVERDPDPVRHRVNVAGFVIHSAVHLAREDMQWVIHVHTASSSAVSAQEDGLLPISQHALRFYERLAYHDYEGIALDTDERERLIRDLGPHKAMMLRNHGVLVGAPSAAEAFSLIYFLEQACRIQISAMSGNARLRVPTPAVCEKTAKQFDSPGECDVIELAWQAALRLIGDQATEYRS